MTICIAAMCDNGKKVVIASDRMVTAERYMVKFEHGNHKIQSIRNNCVLVSAGDALACHEVLQAAEEFLEELKSPSIADIADILKLSYKSVRGMHAEDKIQGQWPQVNGCEEDGPLGIPPEEMYRGISGEMYEYDLMVDLLVCGVDKKGGHIYRVSHPGTSICFDPLGQHAIGAGEPHAVTALIASGYDSTMPLKNSLFLVYASKKIAEKAPGVGEKTDMCYVDENGTHSLDEEQMAHLEKVYQKKVQAEISSLKRIGDLIDDIPI